jgi:hypothetical protein
MTKPVMNRQVNHSRFLANQQNRAMKVTTTVTKETFILACYFHDTAIK